MTATIESNTTRAPFWAVFGTTAKASVNWADHGQAHQAVMRLFPETLGGKANERRAAAHILYRLDPQADGTVNVLVQSDEPFEMLPLTAQSKTVPEASWAIPDGAVVQLRVAVNPVARNTVHGKVRTRVVSEDETLDWLTKRVGHALSDITVQQQIRTETIGGRVGGHVPPILVVATIDAVATVTDLAAFAELRRHGVGREKSYGCGLLTAFRIG